jgi:hypothetical protein
MAYSRHRTASMLKRYDIISVEDLGDAAEKTSQYRPKPNSEVVPLGDATPGGIEASAEDPETGRNTAVGRRH